MKILKICALGLLSLIAIFTVAVIAIQVIFCVLDTVHVSSTKPSYAPKLYTAEKLNLLGRWVAVVNLNEQQNALLELTFMPDEKFSSAQITFIDSPSDQIKSVNIPLLLETPDSQLLKIKYSNIFGFLIQIDARPNMTDRTLIASITAIQYQAGSRKKSTTTFVKIRPIEASENQIEQRLQYRNLLKEFELKSDSRRLYISQYSKIVDGALKAYLSSPSNGAGSGVVRNMFATQNIMLKARLRRHLPPECSNYGPTSCYMLYGLWHLRYELAPDMAFYRNWLDINPEIRSVQIKDWESSHEKFLTNIVIPSVVAVGNEADWNPATTWFFKHSIVNMARFARWRAIHFKSICSIDLVDLLD